ncbi:hypothetical protein Acr_02g0004380 [Actinidia rufa]|uniref:Transposase MuDR plant domain-containing protein n=1 Tax=Actinidia rufa TaxID=165716 RepID=A0A7J0E6Y5_9ERIC|nr:hypothetical protein Acr_02g0004380 [Actinidia rufa]
MDQVVTMNQMLTIFFLDSIYDLDEEDDALFEQNVDEEIEWTGTRKVSGQGETDSTTGPEIVSDTESEDWASSDGFRSMEGSSDEEHRLTQRFREFKPISGRQDPVFETGMIFKNRVQFAGVVRHHAILHGRDVRFTQNENTRVTAVCREGCPSLIFASCKTGHKKTLQVKTWGPVHKCGRSFDNSYWRHVIVLMRRKAPRPENFTLELFKSCWNVSPKDFMEVFHHIHEHGSI